MTWTQITYRRGKPLAAYLYLERRPGDKSARTERHGSWVVDFSANGRAIGVEFLNVAEVEIVAVEQRACGEWAARGFRSGFGADEGGVKGKSCRSESA